MDYQFVRTTCPYCGCGCQMLLEVCEGELLGTLPLKTATMNQGKLCIKGWYGDLTRPLIRKDGALQEASWEEALDTVVTRMSAITDQHGSQSLAFLSSARTTNEENYLLQKLSRAGFGTNNVDHCARL